MNGVLERTAGKVRVIERVILPGPGKTRKTCEDRIIARPDGLGVAVVDGATSLNDATHEGHTAGWWAAKAFEDAFLASNAANPAFVEQVIHGATEALHQLERRHKLVGHAVFSMVLPARREVVWVGDCIAMPVKAGDMVPATPWTSPLACEARSSALRAKAIFAAREEVGDDHGALERIGRAAITQVLADNRKLANLDVSPTDPRYPMAYGVLGPKKVPGRFIQRQNISADVDEIVLATDGVPEACLCGTWDSTRMFLDMLRESDSHLVGYGAIEVAGTKGFYDSDGNLHKCFDDTSYVRVGLI